MASVRLTREFRMAGPSDTMRARIIRTRTGRVAVVTTGSRPVTVTLRLVARATTESAALRRTYAWRVPAAP